MLFLKTLLILEFEKRLISVTGARLRSHLSHSHSLDKEGDAARHQTQENVIFIFEESAPFTTINLSMKYSMSIKLTI
ncbi:hypothetical protein ACFQPF_04600 [Fictibacillus iocasae]|uniref:Uncharacterized protein n=1 Tax=Fictibacillus iocasae TaxID=2715437 RepID=A0ABW2NME1_9BACL